MQGIRCSHKFGRLLAVWLLLWFAAMAATPLPLGALSGASSLEQVQSIASDEDECLHAEHANAGAPESHGEHGDAAGQLHAGHGSGSLSHCPLCLHAAAPPPALFTEALPRLTPQERAAPRVSMPLTARTDFPPPPRGPPLFS